ncbi:AraC family transcriptional regulator [Alteribacter aurantiacus]|uniref:AraC family transcriptional regulator n=1 Tax=Alteribacter aurantiacus TaxID=254410 RepID=UPI0003FAF189|nr:helix-turn-helix domain-containing protein [Alteribacter aurantiacus]
MPTLLIADRDQEECQGIQWLIERSTLPFTNTTTVHTSEDMLTTLDQAVPDVLIVELDLLTETNTLTKVQSLNHTAIIATTNEPTYEKALLALKMQALDLLITPHTPTKLQALLKTATKQTQFIQRTTNTHSVVYEDLFVEKNHSRAFKAVAFALSNPDSNVKLFDFLHVQSYPGPLFPLSDWTFTLSTQESSSLLKEVRQLVERWHDQYPSLPLAAIVHTPESRCVSDLYKQTKALIPITFYKGFTQVYSYDRPLDWKKIDPFLTPKEQREWVDMLAQKDTKKVKDWLYRHFLSYESPFPEPQLVRTRLTSILAQVRRYMRTYQLDRGEDETAYQKLYEAILHGPTISTIVQDLYLFIHSTVTHEPGSMDAVERGIVYITSQLEDPTLTLFKVGQAIGQSPGYFSEQLKKREGQSFRSYLISVRLKKAASLLKNSTLSIKEIAHTCGFMTSNYFTRVFKNHYGMTPRTYRHAKRKV